MFCRSTLTSDRYREFAHNQQLIRRMLMRPGGEALPSLNENRRRTRQQNHANPNANNPDFRRSIYDQNLWAMALADVTGFYRETSPNFYR